MGRQQYASVAHPDITDWLVWLVNKDQNKNRFLWPGSQQKFRALFQDCCKRLRLTNCRFSPASLRAGGATTWHVDSHRSDIGRLRFEGRWSNVRSLEHYVQVARAQQLLLQIPDATSHRIGRLIQQFSFLLSLPQFLALKLPSQHLFLRPPLTIDQLNDVARECRDWGKPSGSETALQEESDRRRQPERRTLPRHRTR